MLKKSAFVSKALRACVAGALILGLAALVGCGNSSDAQSNANTNANTNANVSSDTNANVSAPANANSAAVASSDTLMSGIHQVVMEVEGYDPITIELDADAAPITVTNFVKLVEDGYYDGLTFYRIQDGFVIQGGTKGNSASGSDPSLSSIPGEFSSNGYTNPLADEFGYGTIAMARTNNPNSATSTFFITLADNSVVGSSLDGLYAAFGTIDPQGMATIEKIVADNLANVDPSSPMGAITNPAGQPIIKSITLID